MQRTTAFASPEMSKGLCGEWRGVVVDATACDIWALGCLGLILFTGSNPFAPMALDQDPDQASWQLHVNWVRYYQDCMSCYIRYVPRLLHYIDHVPNCGSHAQSSRCE